VSTVHALLDRAVDACGVREGPALIAFCLLLLLGYALGVFEE
jgi:hypothetical protein